MPPPWKADVQTLALQIARGTAQLIAKRANRQDSDEDPGLLAADQANSLRKRSSAGNSGPWTDGPVGLRQAFHYGYSLHAERIVNSDNRESLEKLCRYASRAPIAMSRLSRQTTVRLPSSSSVPATDAASCASVR